MSKPTLTPEQTKGLEKVFSSTLLVAIKHMGLNKSCLSCANFDETQEVCKLAGKRPPARTIVEGCEAHETNMPF